MLPVDTRAALSHHFLSGRVQGTQVCAKVMALSRTISVCLLLSSPLCSLLITSPSPSPPWPRLSPFALSLDYCGTTHKSSNKKWLWTSHHFRAYSINSNVEIEAVQFIAAFRRHLFTRVFEAMPDIYTVLHTKSETAPTTKSTTVMQQSLYCMNMGSPSNVRNLQLQLFILF